VSQHSDEPAADAPAAEAEALDSLARGALRHYDISPDAIVDLVNASENRTYRVEDPANGLSAALRVHRLGYHDIAEIESELAWIDALREGDVVETLRVVSAADGRKVVTVSTPELHEPRHVALFEWVDGVPPQTDDVASFHRLGALSARMHRHARDWTPPRGFTRFAWDYDTTLGPRGRWGRWQDGLGIGPDECDLLGRVDRAIRARLQEYGKGADRFGLAHADLRLANLLIEGDRTVVLDFDDCGRTWFLYDWGTAVSFIEDDPHVPELQAAWVDGYRSVAPLSVAEERLLPTFTMLRRLLLVAWIGSHHSFATEAAELGASFTAGTCELGERFLARGT
jgi:Ser/Thr protein kinase RdoA (MazF antagonist)